ncbi:MAG: response regulator [Vulcanimicrobiota bacterium]
MIDPADFSLLLVDDDAEVLEVLGDALSAFGYQVTPCNSGLAAVEAAQAHSYDLVVADVRMPGMDGLAAVEKARSFSPQMRSIMISGFAAEADSIRAVRLGVGDYLRKPFKLEELLTAVARQLELCQSERRRWQRESQLRKALLWAMENLSRETGGRLEESRLAEAIARQLGLSSEQSEELRQSLLARQLPEHIGRDGLPSGVLRLLQELEAEEHPGLAARIGRALYGAEPAWPEWEQARQRAVQQPAEDPSAVRRRRGLLDLARGLENSDPPAALKAYQSLAQDTDTTEAMEAELGMLRLSAQPQHRARALEIANRLNPMALTEALFEVARFDMAHNHRDQAAECFSQARRLAGEFGLRGLGAGAFLGQWAAAGGALPENARAGAELAMAELLKPDHLALLLNSAGWLLPLLLSNSEGQAQQQLLAYLARECPGQFSRLGRLPEGEQLAMIAALAGQPELLRAFTADDRPAVRRAAERALSGQAAPRPPLLRIYTLGRFEVYRSEQALSDKAVRLQRGRFLLAWLASTPGPVAVERIIDEFWPDEVEAGRNNLNNTASALRKALRPPDWPEPLDYILRHGDTLEFNRQLPVWVDALSFQQEAAEGSLECLRQAAQLYRGPYLETCYMEWAEALRSRLESTAKHSLTNLLEQLAGRNHWAEILEQGARLLQLDSCCMDTHARIMSALLALKRPEAAVRHFEQAQKTLQRELAMEPSIQLLELYHRAKLSVD